MLGIQNKSANQKLAKKHYMLDRMLGINNIVQYYTSHHYIVISGDQLFTMRLTFCFVKC